MSARLTDVQTQSEYVLHRIEGAQGAFVGRVREEYLAALRAIRAACFERNAFRADVSRALLDGAVPVGELRNLLDESYRLAGEK